jgi:hypothetical protein
MQMFLAHKITNRLVQSETANLNTRSHTVAKSIYAWESLSDLLIRTALLPYMYSIPTQLQKQLPETSDESEAITDTLQCIAYHGNSRA